MFSRAASHDRILGLVQTVLSSLFLHIILSGTWERFVFYFFGNLDCGWVYIRHNFLFIFGELLARTYILVYLFIVWGAWIWILGRMLV